MPLNATILEAAINAEIEKKKVTTTFTTGVDSDGQVTTRTSEEEGKSSYDMTLKDLVHIISVAVVDQIKSFALVNPGILVTTAGSATTQTGATTGPGTIS